MSAAQRAEETAQNPAQQARAVLQIATFLSGRGDNQNALILLDQALKINAQADAPTGRDSAVTVAADIQLIRGDILARLHKPSLEATKEAVTARHKAAGLSPEDYFMRYDLALALRQLGQRQLNEDDKEAGNAAFSEALSIIEALIADSPTDLRFDRFRSSLLFQFA